MAYLKYLLFLLIGTACHQNSNVTLENQFNEQEKKNEIIDGNYKLVLITKLHPKKIQNGAEYNFNSVIEEQTLHFFEHESEINKSILPFPKITVESIEGDSIKVVENAIIELGVLKGETSNLFVVQGQGHCNACPEFFGIYSQKGVLLWYTYSNKYKIFNEYGSFRGAFEQSGADSLEWENGTFKKIKINW